MSSDAKPRTNPVVVIGAVAVAVFAVWAGLDIAVKTVRVQGPITVTVDQGDEFTRTCKRQLDEWVRQGYPQERSPLWGAC